MTNVAKPINNVVVLGGNGAMGTLFCKQFAGIVKQVIAIDVQPKSVHSTENIHYLQADVSNIDINAPTFMTKHVGPLWQF